MSGVIQQAVEKKQSRFDEMAQFVEERKEVIAQSLPRGLDIDRFVRIIKSSITANPALQKCEVRTFFAAAMLAAQLGLEPNSPLGECYIIPYNNTKKNIKEAQFQLGYKGVLSLAYRNAKVKNVSAEAVYKQDTFDINLGTGSYIVHKPCLNANRGEIIGFYAYVEMDGGVSKIAYMSYDEMKDYEKRFNRNNNPVWKNHFNEMAKKTMILKALKYAPRDTEFSRMVAQDNTVRYEMSKNMTSETATYPEDDNIIENEEF